MSSFLNNKQNTGQWTKYKNPVTPKDWRSFRMKCWGKCWDFVRRREVARGHRIVHNEESHNLHSSNDEKYTYQREWDEESELWNAYKIVVENPERKIFFDELDSSSSNLPFFFSEERVRFLLHNSVLCYPLSHAIHPPTHQVYSHRTTYISIQLPFHRTFTLKMAITICSETLEELQHLSWLNHISRSWDNDTGQGSAESSWGCDNSTLSGDVLETTVSFSNWTLLHRVR
jgi:hypothetical protein